MKPLDYASVRKRILMLYFAAGVNLLMGLYVISAGGGVADRGTLWLIALIFLAFAGLNYYIARTLAKRWNARARQHPPSQSEEVKQ